MDGRERLQKLADDINGLFLEVFQNEAIICTIFCQLKFHELSLRFEKCQEFESVADQKMKQTLLLPYLEFTYVETVYLSKMIESNI